mmetsp:Transcript_24533/g.53115  ORF Transcript_24533/g.53115 Transcript_24533/m.53115 type:complete len:201 (+) Transcript_24533:820-1422(+)
MSFSGSTSMTHSHATYSITSNSTLTATSSTSPNALPPPPHNATQRKSHTALHCWLSQRLQPYHDFLFRGRDNAMDLDHLGVGGGENEPETTEQCRDGGRRLYVGEHLPGTHSPPCKPERREGKHGALATVGVELCGVGEEARVVHDDAQCMDDGGVGRDVGAAGEAGRTLGDASCEGCEDRTTKSLLYEVIGVLEFAEFF